MNVARGQTASSLGIAGADVEHPFLAEVSLDASGILVLRWALQFINDLHRLPQNASRRQRRLLAALCSIFGAASGSVSVLTHQPHAPTAESLDTLAPSATPLGTIERVYHVSFEASKPNGHSANGHPAGAANGDASDVAHPCTATHAVFQSTPGSDATIATWDEQVLLHLAAAPAIWQASEPQGVVADTHVVHLTDVARSLIPLGENRYSLLVLRRRSDKPLFNAIELQALGLIHRECAWVCDAPALNGTTAVPSLSPRERETLEHLLAGASEKEVALLLRRSRHTVHSYVKRIYRELGVRSRAELLAIFVDAAGREAIPSAV